MAWDGKKYKLEKSENFDKYMMEIGIGFVLRKVGNTLHPECRLEKHGDEYSFYTTSTFKSSVIKFKLGEEFEKETMDGRKVMTVITMDGNKMTEIEKGEKNSEIIREFSDTELVVTMTCGNTVAKRFYKVIN